MKLFALVLSLFALGVALWTLRNARESWSPIKYEPSTNWIVVSVTNMEVDSVKHMKLYVISNGNVYGYEVTR